MSRLEKLRELEAELREMMGKANTRVYASLARQYRETLREIDELEGDSEQDALSALIESKWQPTAD